MGFIVKHASVHDPLTLAVVNTITLFDALAATLADRLGLEVWTHDHHFDVMRVAVWR
jgi:predicted nucleic acid-binding protein